MVTLNVLNVLQGEGSESFNYFITLMLYMGFFAFNVGLLVKVVNRS